MNLLAIKLCEKPQSFTGEIKEDVNRYIPYSTGNEKGKKKSSSMLADFL